jgi:AAA+ superfamily predicted ATPase
MEIIENIVEQPIKNGVSKKKYSSDAHVANLEKELDWLKGCIERRILSLQEDMSEVDIISTPPKLTEKNSSYGELINRNKLNKEERLALILALSPHVGPNLLNVFAEEQSIQQVSKVCKSENGISLIPTVETALFILTNNNLENRLACYPMFETDHLFYRESILEVGSTRPGESTFNGVLGINPTYRDLFTQNEYRKPRFSEDFPAHPVTTKLEWEDMVLMPNTQDKLDEVKAYLEHYDTLVNDWGMDKHSKKGCRILFYGDPGTGKTLSACLLGKYLNKEVFRVDISTVTSKYIGETSKRLNSLFNTAESKDWVLFFDEGDALLGQRKNSDAGGQSSQYANQDTAFLLQRIENYDGIIIVATNLKNNIDQAFTRRFQAMVRFQMLDEAGQLKFWKDNLPKKCPLANDINLELIVRRFQLAPASIINVIFRVCVLTLKNGNTKIASADLMMCLKDEEVKYKGRKPVGV